MKLLFSLRILITTATIACSSFVYADVYVISHSDGLIGSSDIKDVFTGEKQFAGTVKLVLVDNGQVQEQFLNAALGIGSARYNTIWTKKSFREGVIPPSVKAGDNEVMDFVSRTPGAVGYIRSEPRGVAIIRKY